MNEKYDESKEFKLRDSSFLIRIIYRQNASWQGEIQWLKGDEKEAKKVYFRSQLELLMLMQEAMDAIGTPEADYRFRSWEDEGRAGNQHLNKRG